MTTAKGSPSLDNNNLSADVKCEEDVSSNADKKKVELIDAEVNTVVTGKIQFKSVYNIYFTFTEGIKIPDTLI